MTAIGEETTTQVATVLIFAVTASSALIVGALVGTHWQPPQRLLATVLAFAGGSLTAALAFELFQESFVKGGLLPSAIGMLGGAGAFITVDSWLDRRVRTEAAAPRVWRSLPR